MVASVLLFGVYGTRLYTGSGFNTSGIFLAPRHSLYLVIDYGYCFTLYLEFYIT